jgi:hypothetical protein
MKIFLYERSIFFVAYMTITITRVEIAVRNNLPLSTTRLIPAM